MTIGGLASAAIVWALFDNVWCGVVGLVLSGMVFNAISNPGSRPRQRLLLRCMPEFRWRDSGIAMATV